MRREDSWPWPGDTALDRARRIANSLVELLPPGDRERHIATAHRLGETWLGERMMIYTDDQAITTSQAAELVFVTEDVIRQWACKPHPRDPGRKLLPRHHRQGREMTYLVRNVLDAAFEVSQRRRRANRVGQRS